MLRGSPLLVCAPLLVLVAVAGPDSVRAQPGPDLGGEEEYVYRYARPGEATQTVYIWGAVDQPGIWEIEPGTDIVELFSVVRPSGYGVEGIGTKTRIELRIYRSTNGEPRVVSEMQLGDLLEMPPPQRPSLQPEDVIEVRTVESRKFSFQTVGTIVGTLSSLTLLVIRIFEF